MNKTDTCHNHCYNDYATSAVTGYQSYYRCGDQCVQARDMCRGYPLCPDSRDVRECDEDLQCVQDPQYSHNKSVLVSDLSSGHYYCDYDRFRNDGIYHTISRQDELDLNIRKRIQIQINYTSITHCNNAGVNSNKPGLMCGEECVEHREWCLKDRPISCGRYNFSTDNQQLCSNTTFWTGMTCDKFFTDGVKNAVGRRCTDAAQHCSYPWYTSSIYFYEVRLLMNNSRVCRNK